MDTKNIFVENNDRLNETCEEPLPPPQPYKAPTRIETFLEELRVKINNPKKMKNNASSKLLQHFQVEEKEKFGKLNEAIMRIGAKQISLIKYYKDLPKVAEDIGLCYLLLFNIPVPKSHY